MKIAAVSRSKQLDLWGVSSLGFEVKEKKKRLAKNMQ